MMNVYDSTYISVTIEGDLLCHYWKESSKYMSDDIYKTEILHLVPMIEKHRPTKYLLNSELFAFTITPDIQDWTNKHIIAVNFAAGIRYSAMVVPQDFFAFASVEQTMDDFEKKDLNNRFFAHKREARAWLTTSLV